MHQLKIENVTKRYGKRPVVEDLSFTLEPGRVTGFLGPNGAGKSTTMKILLDLAPPTTATHRSEGCATATLYTRRDAPAFGRGAGASSGHVVCRSARADGPPTTGVESTAPGPAHSIAVS
jgi:energy-coupling factor transporter ATP-binding protein EcfA2